MEMTSKEPTKDSAKLSNEENYTDLLYDVQCNVENAHIKWQKGKITRRQYLTILKADRERIRAHTAAQVAAAETIGRAKEAEASCILPEFAFEHGIEWFIHGVKVPKSIARKISDAAKSHRDGLLAHLTTGQKEGDEH